MAALINDLYEVDYTVSRCVRISIKGLVRRSVGWSVGCCVTLSLFGQLGATDAVYTALFRCVCISIRGLVCRSVGWSVGWSVGRLLMLSSKSMKNGLLRILNDLDTAGRGIKEGRGGRRDEEEGGMRRKDEGR